MRSLIPKAYAYADDVNCILNNDLISLQALFNEYDRLTNLSGLCLNADKTEIMRIKKRHRHLPAARYRIRYLDKDFEITPKQRIKINGVIFQQEAAEMKEANVTEVLTKIDAIFKQWSRRSLSLLGKVLIVKTFGISQLIYLMQSIVLEPCHLKRINATLYKYIWNRHYLAAKAPERIKREIMNTPIKKGGFGMLDVAELDDSLKLRALGRLVSTSHPMLSKVKNSINWSDYLAVTVKPDVEEVTSRAIKLLNLDRNEWGKLDILDRNRQLLALIGDRQIGKAINQRGRSSLAYFLIRQTGARKIAELNGAQLDSIARFVNPDWLTKVRNSIGLRAGVTLEDKHSYYDGRNLQGIQALSTKEFRMVRNKTDQICIFKLGLILTPIESRSWLFKINRLTSVKHKSVVLRIAHGEIYTREKLHRYNLVASNECLICQEVDTLEHKFITCDYVRRIWQVVNDLDGLNPDPQAEPEQAILGAWLNSDILNVTVRAEILLRLSYLREQNYVIRPKIFVKLAIESLVRKEQNTELKNQLVALLQ